ncbi:tubulin--tyrosine ligase-like protein 12 [Periplaneta americana]|uniref:tubulin--tyrosine ligase-like protein 12 n=1 Tax=Periplaneta americana TaxID=6978 RepID=UPI0037E8A1AF
MDSEKDGISLFPSFVAYHRLQLESSGVPAHFWEVLCRKLKDQIFDAGNTFEILKIESETEEGKPSWKVVVSREEGVEAEDASHIYLIDHAWTYHVADAKQHLRDIDGLLERMKSLMGFDDESSLDEEVDAVFNEMWKYNQTYTIGSMLHVEERVPVWYIMDEFGSAIQHSDEPTFRVVPFIHMPQQIPYTLLFPIKNVPKGKEVTRDYVEGPLAHSEIRDALLLPWFPKSFMMEDFRQQEPDDNYFLEGHTVESLPDLEINCACSPKLKGTLKVYSEYKFVNDYLKHPKFEITCTKDDADVLWYTHHFTDYRELQQKDTSVFVNQFPFENVITIKDLLCIVSRRNANDSKNSEIGSLETRPLWLPTTFNLKTELPKFVSYYQHREKEGLDNHWICKPWNLARGLDTHITNNLNYILRLPFTGPKIAQKYLEDPVLFKRAECGFVKFDIRYVILLKSVQPLVVYAYKNFFLRFSNKSFELRDFEDYEKHFTVMNYNEAALLYRKLCHEFVEDFEIQYPDHNWKDTERKIFDMLRELFVAATSKKPPRGIAHSPQSRALYAADIMLAWQTGKDGCRVMQPKLLEVNWTPDCQRACEYYPDFYDDIFGLLFLDEEKDVFQVL